MTPLAAPPEASSGLGDPETWVDLHGDALLRFAMLRVGDQSTAEDLVQETLLAAWRGRASFTGQCEPRTWLVAILKRRVADYYRSNGRRATTEVALVDEPSPASRQPPPRSEAETVEFWDIVALCTGNLPDHLARAFRQRTFGDAAPEAICDAEGISRKNLSVRLHRARRLLQQCLESRWFGGGSPRKQGQP